MKLAAVVLLACVACVEGTGWWMEQPYGNDDFNIRVEYGEDKNITCEDPRLEGMSYSVKYWVLPDMTIMYANDYIDFKTLDGYAGWEVSNDVRSIRLFILTENHFGFYYCLADANGTDIMVKRAVNYRGPFFDDLWDDYRLNTIVGFSSSAVFLGIAGGAYGISVYLEKRHGGSSVEPVEADGFGDEEKRKEEMEEGGEGGEGMSNGAYVAELKEKIVDQQPTHSAEEAATNV